MALRPGRTVRKLKRPYTRVSRRKPKKSYVVGVPHKRIRIFEMGNKKKKFENTMWLVSKSSLQIRDNALESARIVCNKLLERSLGPENYFLKVLVYPHQVLREHSLATGAGADRFSSGMRKSFGKPSGLAVRIKKDQEIFSLKLDKKNLRTGRKAFKRAESKLPTTCTVKIKE
jgi:large subunit ribosomal protein L10e